MCLVRDLSLTANVMYTVTGIGNNGVLHSTTTTDATALQNTEKPN